ncbi:MAG: hypothetical protein R6W90_12010 [Ignavibacteriaceae bacterium]
MNRLDTTLDSLSYLIENLYRNRTHYSGLANDNPALTPIVEPLNIRINEFLFKLMNEYKRLSKNEYKLEAGVNVHNDSSHNNNLDEFLRTEENLITLYAEVIDEDVLWEVIPVLAQHLAFLKNYQEYLLDYSKIAGVSTAV